MRSGGPGSRSAKLTAAACLLAVALAAALGLSACGGGSPAATANAESPAASTAKPSSRPEAVPASGAGICASQVGAFIGAMDTLRTNLVAGLSYEQYVGEVEAIRGTYHRIPAERLALGCLKAAGTPGENGLNKYIEASNTWTDCVEARGCEAASIEPALQSRWRQASKLLSEAQRGLKETRR